MIYYCTDARQHGIYLLNEILLVTCLVGHVAAGKGVTVTQRAPLRNEISNGNKHLENASRTVQIAGRVQRMGQMKVFRWI